MLKNYLTSALRNLLSRKLFAAINVCGLAFGIAACVLILLFVRDELSYDDWIPDSERVFKMELTIPIAGRPTLMMGQVPPGIPPAMEAYFADHIEDTTRVLQVETVLGSGDRFFNEVVSFVDADFFNVFDLPMVAGDRTAFADNVTSILINETLAFKLFGDRDPVNQVLSSTLADTPSVDDPASPLVDFRVAGVFKDIPRNSHLPFQAFAVLDPVRFQGINEGFGGAWLSAAYVKFLPHVNPADVESRLTEFYSNVAPPRGDETETFDYRTDRQFNLINVADVHLYSDKVQQLKPIGDIGTVISFALAAGLILLIAAINFMNLSTAQALRRAKEVSMRKVLGAKRRQLIHQFLGESVLTAMLALIAALLLVEFVLPFFSQYLHKSLALNLVTDPLQTLTIVFATAMVGLLGGLYPAFFLSSYRPAHVMGASSSKNKGSPLIRQALVVFQFAISIALIISTVIVNQQTSLLRNMDLGIETEQQLAIVGLTGAEVGPMEATIRQEMLNIPGVTAASLSSDELPLVFYNDVSIETPGLGTTEVIDTDRIYVDENFFDVYGIEAVAGRLYGEEFTADALVRTEEEGVPWTRSAVVTEQFVRAAGLDNPEAVIGETLVISDWGGDGIHLHATVVGVIGDLHLRSLRERTAQLVFFASSNVLDVMTLKVRSADLAATLAEVDRVWNEVVPEVPINRYFVGDKYDALYDSEERRSQVFTAFSIFAVLVACLGLFGLASFSAEQRTLEIGMRKVMGARIGDILLLVGAQFMKSVVVANVIAWPIVYYVMRNWLNNYEYRIDISPLVFVTSGLLAVALAWLTVGWRVYKVARVNPIRALRYE
jgi:putative ABC transport system permease protein